MRTVGFNLILGLPAGLGGIAPVQSSSFSCQVGREKYETGRYRVPILHSKLDPLGCCTVLLIFLPPTLYQTQFRNTWLPRPLCVRKFVWRNSQVANYKKNCNDIEHSVGATIAMQKSSFATSEKAASAEFTCVHYRSFAVC